ncbi:MAG: hypothetical protein ACE37K_05220 [Planctomycetota bacterium]
MEEAETLRMVIGERHEYYRMTMRQLVVWFTAFTSLNMAAMGAFAYAVKSKDWHTSQTIPFALVGCFLLSQSVLGERACANVARLLRESAEQIASDTAILVETTQSPLANATPSTPSFCKSIAQMRMALLGGAVAWVGLIAYLLVAAYGS